MNFNERIRKEVMILDGSMGVFLQQEGLPSGYAPDLWNLEKPDIIANVHKEYVKAGSQIVITNTFGASAPRLADYDAASKVKEINHAGVEIARKAVGDKALVAGGFGPSGKMIAPIGEFSFRDAVEVFAEQARALVEAGADVLIIETMFDLMETKAAIVACNSVRKDIPLIASMTYTSGGLTDTGTTPEAAAAVMEGLGVDVIGINCSTGPGEMIDTVKRLGEATSLPIMIEPNAGLPVMEKGQTLFKEPSDSLAGFAPQFVELGANIIGGCCGTKPDYIEKVSKLVKGKPPASRSGHTGVVIASRSDIVRIGVGHPFVKIGEKINPTGKKKFSAAIKEGRLDLVLAEARKEAENGAMALDVNVGVPMIDEPAMMYKAIAAIQNVTKLPIVIDSSDDKALESGLSIYAGRALVNSVNAEPEKLESVLPMVHKYGAAVMALCAGEDIPESAEKRFEYAKIILDRALEIGLRREDIVFDCLAVVASAMQEGSRQTLRLVRMIREELGCATTLGISNTSFGLPDRPSINNHYIAMAMGEGLDAAIVNPYSAGMHKAVAAASIFTGRDEGCKEFIDFSMANQDADGSDKINKKAGSKGEAVAKKENLTPQERVYEMVLEGEKDSIQDAVQKALDKNVPAMDLFMDSMTPAIRQLGDLFAEKKKFIPHLVASADTMKKGMELITPILKSGNNVEAKGTIIFATVKGDVHDIGKNVCCIMLENFGFNVIDLGRSVPTEDIFAAAKEHNADILALSALMTTTMVRMPEIINHVKENNLPYKVMVGGAVVTKSFANEIGADAYGKDVGGVAALAESLIKK